MVLVGKIDCGQCALSGQVHLCEEKRKRKQPREKGNETVGVKKTINRSEKMVVNETRLSEITRRRNDPRETEIKYIDEGVRIDGGSTNGDGGVHRSAVGDDSDERSSEQVDDVSGDDHLQQAVPSTEDKQLSDSITEIHHSTMVNASSPVNRTFGNDKENDAGLAFRAALDITNASVDGFRQHVERTASERERTARRLEDEKEKAARRERELQDKLDQMQRIVNESKEEENRRLREKVQKLEQREARRDDERRSVNWTSTATVDADKLREEEKCQRVSEVEQTPAARLNLAQCRQLNDIEAIEAARLKEFEADRMRFLSDMETEKQRVMSGAGVSTSRASVGSVATVLRPTATIGDSFNNVKSCEISKELQEIVQAGGREREAHLVRMRRNDDLRRELEASQLEIDAREREFEVSRRLNEEKEREVMRLKQLRDSISMKASSASKPLPGVGGGLAMTATGLCGATTASGLENKEFLQVPSVAFNEGAGARGNNKRPFERRGPPLDASSYRDEGDYQRQSEPIRKLNKKSARLPMFDGSSKGEYAFSFWEDSFKSEMEEGGVERGRWMFNLQRSLTGAALELYQQTVVFFAEASYENVIERLKREFDNIKTPSEYKQDCEKLKWEKGEKIEQFGDRCYAACTRLHRDESDLIREEMVKRDVYDVFMRSMTPHYRNMLRTRGNLTFPGKKVIAWEKLVEWVRELVNQQEEEDMMRHKYRMERSEQGRSQSPTMAFGSKGLSERRVQFNKEVEVIPSDSLSKPRETRIQPVQTGQTRSFSSRQNQTGQNRPFNGGYQGQQRYGQQNVAGNNFGNANNWQQRQQNPQNLGQSPWNRPPNPQQPLRPQINQQRNFMSQGNQQGQQQGFRQPYRSQNAEGSMQRPQQQPQGSQHVQLIGAAREQLRREEELDDIVVDLGPQITSARGWRMNNRIGDNGNGGPVQSITTQKEMYVDPMFETSNFFAIFESSENGEEEGDEIQKKREIVSKLGGAELTHKAATSRNNSSSRMATIASGLDLGIEGTQTDLKHAPRARTRAVRADATAIASGLDLGIEGTQKDLKHAPRARTRAVRADATAIASGLDLGIEGTKTDLKHAPRARTRAISNDPKEGQQTANILNFKGEPREKKSEKESENQCTIAIVTLPMRIEGKGKVFEAQVDTGSPIVIVNKEIMGILIERYGNEEIGKKLKDTDLIYRDVQKRQIQMDGVIDIEFEVLGKKVLCQAMVMSEAAQPILVGMKFMQKIGMDLVLNLGKSKFVWKMEPSTVLKDGDEQYGRVCRTLDGLELPMVSKRSERLSKKKDERTRCKALAVGKETSTQGTEKQSAYLLRVFNIKESEAGFGKMIMGDRDHWRDKEVLIEGGSPKGGVVIPDQLAQIDKEGLVWVEIVNHNAEPMFFGPGEIAVNVSEFYQRSRITANHRIDACVKCRANASDKTVAFVHTPTSTPNYFNLPVGDMRERRQIIREKLELEKNNPFLSESDCERVKDFLAENHDVIALDDYDLGKCNLTDFAHKIDTGDTPPIAIPRRRIPQGMREGEQKTIDTMLSTGVIRPSKSPWSSPIVPVQKPDGSIRICVDYRKLNFVTKKDRYPLTRCDDLVDSMGDVGPEIFTTLDLVQGYHQQIMDPDSIEKTAFTCSAGHFEYTRLPMGLTNSPANFQRLQTELLRGLDGNRIKVYLDDVAIVSKTVDEHLDLLDDVFDRFRQAGLRVKLKKCKFLRTEVLYLGYIVNRDGMKPNPARLESVANAKAPKTVKEIRQFLGLCSFYRRFVKNFSVIALPLSELTKKEQKWVWGDKQQIAFETLKERLVTPPLLRYPTFNKPFYIFCDASVEGLGAVLNQKDEEGKYYVVAYASRSTHQSERFYTATELECLCIAWALTQFHFYIWNQEVTIETDHKPLECLPGKATLPARIERWNTLISSYGPTIVYRKGSENGPADMLSRYGQEAGSAKEKAFDEIELLGLVNDLEQRESWQTEQRRLQMEDTDFKEVILSLENKPVSGTNEHRKQIKKMQTHYHLEKGVLYFEALIGEQARICVAKQEREGLIRTYHQMKYAGAHFGAGKTYKSMSQRFFWPRMKQEVREFCQKCLVCAKQKGVEKCQRQPMTPVAIPAQPFEQIGIDIMKLTKTKKGNIKVLGVVDYFSGYIIFVPIKDETAVTVASKLVKHVFNVYGAPKTILSDQGVNFTSLILEELEKIYQVKHKFTTTFMPRANGKVERANQTVQRILTRMMVDYPEEWDELVSHATFAFNGVPHETTGLSPFLVVFGHYPPPLHESVFDRRAIGNRIDLDDYVSELQRRLAYVHRMVENAVGKSQVRAKKQFDKTAKATAINMGDTVMLYRPDRKKTKLSPRFDGPFVVIWTNDTNAGIRKVGKKAIETHNLEKLSKCPEGMENSGPSGEKERRKRRVVEGKKQIEAPKTNPYNMRDHNRIVQCVNLQTKAMTGSPGGSFSDLEDAALVSERISLKSLKQI